ncbi:MAG: NHLP leader peptide family RiPP precursor [Chlamydiales bacterium]
MTKHHDFEKLRAKIIVKAWKDPQFKKRLMENPRAAFQEMGLVINSDEIKIRAIEDTANSYTFVIPPSPANDRELSEGELEKVAGGFWKDTKSKKCWGAFC